MSGSQRALWRVAVLALIVYSLRNSVLRSREFDADARARELDPEVRLDAVLAGLPARPGWRAWQLGGKHPSGAERAAALRDPAPLYRCGFWDGLAVGLVAALGASAAREIVTLMTTTVGLRLLAPALIFGAFAGAALTVAMWRNQFPEADTGMVKGWAAGAGLGLGLAAGPIIALTAAYGPALAPDHPSLAAVGVLVVWAALAVLVFMPFPVWLGYWADAWQQRANPAPRVAARGAMAAAAVAAWAVMACGLYLLMLDPAQILTGTGAATVLRQLPQVLRSTGSYIVIQPSGWAVCLAIVGVPLAAAVAHHRWRRSGETHDVAMRHRRPGATVWLFLAGCLAATALILAVSTVTHARIAEPVRWSPDFLVRLVSFDEQVIVVVAVACSLIAAARARSAPAVAICVVLGAAVAAVGAVVLSNAGVISRCFAPLSIQYAHPPGGSCVTSPASTLLQETVLGATLASILFVPIAHRTGILTGRRLRRAHRPTGAKVTGWLAATAAVIVAVAATALWGPGASAHGVKPMGSIGHDGWIRGSGFEIRLIPNWYAHTQPGKPGLIVLTYPLDGATIDLLSGSAGNPAEIAGYRSLLLRLGARPSRLDGALGLRIARSGLPHGILEQRFIVRRSAVYLITLTYGGVYLEDSPYLRNSLVKMLNTWHWTTVG